MTTTEIKCFCTRPGVSYLYPDEHFRDCPRRGKSWEETMDPDEVRWCREQIAAKKIEIDAGPCTDNERAARIWISSQRRRYRKVQARGCCGSHDWIAKRWNWRKLRYDIYMLGFNYGH